VVDLESTLGGDDLGLELLAEDCMNEGRFLRSVKSRGGGRGEAGWWIHTDVSLVDIGVEERDGRLVGLILESGTDAT
jgi:hypothetical protein